MAVDFRGVTWVGSTIATAQAGVPAGFTAGRVYEVKGAAIDNTASVLYALILDDNHNVRAISLPTSGSGVFTFQ